MKEEPLPLSRENRTLRKRCPYCGRLLELTQFHFSRTATDGLQSYCKDCQQRYRVQHPSKEYKLRQKDTSLRIRWSEEPTPTPPRIIGKTTPKEQELPFQE